MKNDFKLNHCDLIYYFSLSFFLSNRDKKREVKYVSIHCIVAAVKMLNLFKWKIPALPSLMT